MVKSKSWLGYIVGNTAKDESHNGCFKETKYAKFSEKKNISYPLIRTRMCAYQGVRNVSFSEIFVYVLTLPAQIDVTPQQLIFWEFSTHNCYFTQRVY